MSKRQSATERILKLLLSFLYDRLIKEIDIKVRDCISEIARQLIKKIILATVGAVLILIGILFLCVSLVNYIQIYLPTWLAWFSVGFFVLVIGFLISLLTLRRK